MLLAGVTPSQGHLDELCYRLDAWHICVVVMGVDATKMLRLLQARLGCELLLIGRPERRASGCLGAQRKLSFEDIERVLSDQARDMDVALATGEPARGSEGLRQSHRQAEAAALVARCEPRRLTRYADVEPEATALQDDVLGDSLIERYVSPLDEMSIGGQEARRTVRALLEAGGNVSAAARALPADRVTVHRRREAIQQRLGLRLGEHWFDIQRALRIEDLRQRRDSQG